MKTIGEESFSSGEIFFYCVLGTFVIIGLFTVVSWALPKHDDLEKAYPFMYESKLQATTTVVYSDISRICEKQGGVYHTDIEKPKLNYTYYLFANDDIHANSYCMKDGVRYDYQGQGVFAAYSKKELK